MWNEWPWKSSIPGMPGSLALCSRPPQITTKRAENTSPRLVVTCQRETVSSHSIAVISVWKTALRYMSKWRPSFCAYSKISWACA